MLDSSNAKDMQASNKAMRILLLDVDGVIVDPLAYRAGVTKTLELLCGKIGLVNLQSVLPTSADIGHMEACGIHDVWDITNIMFSWILEAICLQHRAHRTDSAPSASPEPPLANADTYLTGRAPSASPEPPLVNADTDRTDSAPSASPEPPLVNADAYRSGLAPSASPEPPLVNADIYRSGSACAASPDLPEGHLPHLGEGNLAKKLSAISASSPKIQKPNYVELANQLATASEPQFSVDESMTGYPVSELAVSHQPHPPHIALDSICKRLRAETHGEHRKNSKTPNQSSIDDWAALHTAFLGSTRSVHDSYGTRLFQNVILGAEEFRNTYQLESEYDGPPLLRTVDKPLMNAQSVRILTELNSREDSRVAIYTARPSHPPSTIVSHIGYSPEAEAALELAGLRGFPLIAMGMMEWLASGQNERSEDLTKPNTTQAFAALIAAVSQRCDVSVLEEAYRLDKLHSDPLSTSLNPYQRHTLTIYVFEDTVSGIRPVLKVAELLNAVGFSIVVVPLGIASQQSKRDSLAPLCAQLFLDVNEAIHYMIQQTLVSPKIEPML